MKDIKIEMFGVRPEEKSYLEIVAKSNGMPSSITYVPDPIKPGTKLEKSQAEVISVFVDSVVNSSILDSFPSLKLVAARSTGYDHIDVAECNKRGIVVCNVPTYGECTVAEFAFALILSLTRKIQFSSHEIRHDAALDYAKMRGTDIFGKTIGIIGTGKIGKHSIRIAKGFGMRVVAYDIFKDEKAAKELDFEYLSLDEVLSTSDIVSIHIPYSKDTHHLIDGKALSMMKKNAYLINTSRGGIVDTSALLLAITNGTIAGAGLDVLEEEDVVKDEIAFLTDKHPAKHDLKTVLADHALLNMPNVIITPHNAYNSEEALQRILNTTLQNIKAWADGARQNIVSN